MLTRLRSFFPADRKRVILLLLSIVASIFLGFVAFDAKDAVTIVHRAGYFWMLLIVILFGFAFYQAFQWSDIQVAFRKAGKTVLVLIAVITAWIHFQEPHGFKVVNDEIMLASSSQRMHERRESGIVARGYTLGSDYTVMQGVVDKRPLLYAFFVSVIHDFTGYRPENVFWLNALLTPVFLYLLYFLGREIGGHVAGIGAVLLWATLPLFVQITNGGGFELLNLVLIVTVFLLGLKYIQTRQNALLNVFCMGAVLLSQVRYESVLYVVPVGLVIIYGWILDRKISLPWAVLCAPLLLIITPLQANVVKLSPVALQLKDRPSEGGVYNISYFYDNVGSALNYFIATDGQHANSHLLAVLGIVGVSFAIMLAYRQAKSRKPISPKELVIKIMLSGLAGQSLLMLCYFWGDFNDLITVRLSLPNQILFVLAFIYIYPELVSWRYRWNALIAVSIIFTICWTMPVVNKRGYSTYNVAAEYTNWCARIARSMDDRRAVVVDSASRVWSLYGIGCIGPETLATRAEGFLYHFNRKSFTKFIVSQKLEVIDVKTGEMAPAAGYDFGKSFVLKPLGEIVYTPVTTIRLSYIEAINEKEFLAWAKKKLDDRGKPAPPDRLTPEEAQAFAREWQGNLP